MLNMNKSLIFLAAALLVCGPVIAKDIAKDAAVVNGKSIPMSRVKEIIVLTGQADSPDVRKAITDGLIAQEIISQESENKGLLKQPGTKEALAQAREMVLGRALFSNYLKSKGLTDEKQMQAQIQAEYEKVKAATVGVKEYHVRHILVENEADAKSLITTLSKDVGKFDELAKSKSKDLGTATNGGDLGWVSPQSLVPEFSKAMQTLSKNELSKQPIKTQFGWHVIQMMDGPRNVEVPPLEKIKGKIFDVWQRDKFQEMLGELRNKAKISVN